MIRSPRDTWSCFSWRHFIETFWYHLFTNFGHFNLLPKRQRLTETWSITIRFSNTVQFIHLLGSHFKIFIHLIPVWSTTHQLPLSYWIPCNFPTYIKTFQCISTEEVLNLPFNTFMDAIGWFCHLIHLWTRSVEFAI